jgi:hypothetical protein
MVVVSLLASSLALLIRTSSVVQMILLSFLPLVLHLLPLSLGSPLQQILLARTIWWTMLLLMMIMSRSLAAFAPWSLSEPTLFGI